MSSEEPNQKNMEIHTSKNILTNLSYNCLRTDHINTSVWYYAIDDILKKNEIKAQVHIQNLYIEASIQYILAQELDL